MAKKTRRAARKPAAFRGSADKSLGIAGFCRRVARALRPPNVAIAIRQTWTREPTERSDDGRGAGELDSADDSSTVSEASEPALHELVDELYEDLRGEARRQLAGRPLHTLQPTALLNEALVRLLRKKEHAALNHGQLCTYVAKVMRSVLVDHARAKGSEKRGGGQTAVPLDQVREPVYREDAGVDILAVHDALEVLAREEPEFAELAELRFFGRLSVQEVAAARGVPLSRVKVASQCLRKLLQEEE